MSQAQGYESVIEDLRRLKLSTIRENLDAHLRVAQSKSLTYLEFLQGLTREEIQGREESNYRRRLKSARFPIRKTLEEFDFAFQPTLPRDKILQLKDCRWVANAINVLLAGQSGTGKSHLAMALGLQAIQAGYKVYFTTVADLMDQVNAAAASGQTVTLHKRLLKHDVLILD
jgi:DNA replication protein DnaC